ncbi:MAG: heavy metal translocating P-type ATPase [Phycisphaerales bacterium]
MPQPSTTTIGVRELDCAAEEAVLRKALSSVPGVTAVECDVLNRSVVITHEGADHAQLSRAIKGAGMTPATPTFSPSAGALAATREHDGESASAGECKTCDAGSPATHQPSDSHPASTRAQLVALGLSGVLALGSEVVAWTTKSERSWPAITMAAVSILLGGLPTLRKGFYALKTFTLNINFLMTIAVIGACAIGEWPEAAVVVFLFAVAELIEVYSLDRARNAVRALMEMAPEIAWVKQPDDSWKETPVGEVPAGSVVRVRPGERLALDGVVVAGVSAVNQAPITGESVPVDKAVGDQVFAGTINESGVLEFKVTGGKDQTTLARIIRTVQEAQSARAPTQRFVDRFARVYTPTVVAMAILVALVPPLVFQQPWMRWVYEALVLLVIACPCALVISTPVTVVSGLAAAARRGILIKGGVYLEEGRRLRVIAVDKTGTITEGRPRVQDVRPLNSLAPDSILRLAASIDAGSDHPVARAVTAAWTREKTETVGALFPVQQFTAITGKGVTGTIDGTRYFLGNHRFAHERGVCTPAAEAVLEELEADGQTAVVLTDDRSALGVIAVADAPRESSREAVRQLYALGLRTVMLSGDNLRTAEAIAKGVGIDDARGELLPEDKVASVTQLTDQWGYVGMVGDGVNDAPALAQASIGFAMGAAGTDTALEVADVALMQDDLRGVPAFIQLSRRTARVLRQNITLALGIKVVFFVLALAGVATLWMAVIADVGASLFVIGNGLRLLGGSGREGRV